MARPSSSSRDPRKRRGAAASSGRTGTGKKTHRPDWRPFEPEHKRGKKGGPGRHAKPGSEKRQERSEDARGRDRAHAEPRASRPATRDAAPRTPRVPQPDVVLKKLKATLVDPASVAGLSFSDLGLGQNIVRALAEQGATSPFPIQAATIPDVLAGRHVLGRGRTGSGKTIAFGAPLVERLLQNRGAKKLLPGRKPRALILAPTRELALQIDDTVQPIARSVGLFTTQIYGGVPQGRQTGALKRGVDIIIGTPGRIEDLIEQGKLDLSEVLVTVVDEADHLCELGFLEPVQRILRRTRSESQMLLFSATLDTRVGALVAEFLRDPAVYEIAGETQKTSTTEHRVLVVDPRHKRAVVEELVSGDGKALVFTRTKTFADELADHLDDAGIAALALHGDLSQERRQRNLDKLTSGRVTALVATDVAARGIHVDDIAIVVQADAPDEYKAYLHRAGRTGRAGARGLVVTLVSQRRRPALEELLGRADITARFDAVRPGDRLIRQLAQRA
ncbi:DEAD/DEAH box helicase [Microcella sp.]|uniref:DEAD/DEAH box helicase n=1 Tax=Microcella sp. TaxID=1913979 RepID=UPI00391DE8C1